VRSRNIHQVALIDLFQIALKDTHVIEGFVRAIGPMVGRSETDIPGPLHWPAARPSR
jgi:hypothetical protein